MKKNKGFTLIELLGVITILAVLIMLVAPSVGRVIENSKETSYNTNVAKIEKAAENYVMQNPKLLRNSDIVTIYLYTLKQSGLIEKDIKNPKTNKLFSNMTSVTITKVNGIYQYKVLDSDLLGTTVDTDAPSIALNGDIVEHINVSKTKTYRYDTCTATNPNGTNTACTYTLLDATSVDLTQEGTYQIVYEATNGIHISTLTKTVIVEDTESPVIESDSAFKSVNLFLFNVDAFMSGEYLNGLIVTDNSSDTLANGKISLKIKTNIAETEGNYYIKYIVKDSSGNSASYTRKVSVVTDDSSTIELVLSPEGIERVDESQTEPYVFTTTCSAHTKGNEVLECIYTSPIVDRTQKGTYDVVFSATYQSKTVTKVKRIEVDDYSGPTVNELNSVELYTKELAEYMSLYYTSDIIVTDNSKDTLANGGITLSIETDVAPIPGTYHINYTYTDSSGNSTTKKRIVYVKDRIDIAKLSPMISYNSATAFWQSSYIQKINQVIYYDDLSEIPSNCDYSNNTLCWDMTVASDRKIIAWLVNDTANNGQYKLNIAGKYGIRFNDDSSKYFYNMKLVKSILNFKYVYTDLTSNMNNMFANTGYNSSSFHLDLGKYFNTKKVIDMAYMFYNTGYNCNDFSIDFGNSFNTIAVTTMAHMFDSTGYYSSNFVLDLTCNNLFYPYNVKDLSYMFYKTGYSNTSFTLNLGSNFHTEYAENMSHMFDSTGYSSTVFTLNLSHIRTFYVTDMSYMFAYCGYSSNVFTLNICSFSATEVINFSHMFDHCGYSSSIFNIKLDNLGNDKSTDMSYMFAYCGYSSQSIDIDFYGNVYASSVTVDMSYMFAYYAYSKTGSLDIVSGFGENVATVSHMFDHAGYNTNNFVVLFYGSKPIATNTDMSYLFTYSGYNATENFRIHFDNPLPSGINASHMFYNCRYLKSLSFGSTYTNFATISNYDYIFTGVNNNCNIYLRNTAQINWIVSLPSNYKPSTWYNGSSNFVTW